MYSAQQLESLIDGLYEASLDAGAWRRFLGGLAATLNGKLPTLFLHDTEKKSGSLAISVDWESSLVRDYQEYFSKRNVWLSGGLHLLQVGKVRTSHMMCSRQELLKSEFYAGICKRADFTQGIGATLLEDGTKTSNIAIFADSRHEIGAEQMSLLSALVPHLQRALKTHLYLADVQGRAHDMLAAVNALATGLILVGQQGKVLFMNETAEELIRSHGLRVEQGMLRAFRAADTAALLKMIGLAAKTSARESQHPGGSMTIRHPISGAALELTVTPIRTHEVFSLTERAVAALYISHPTPVRYDSRALAAYGLTPAEHKIAEVIAGGLRATEAAQALGVGYNTVKTHLRRIFQKTQTRRQADLLRLMQANAAPVVRRMPSRR
jgi:DNA-binding CsgD family transcriptional regulator